MDPYLLRRIGDVTIERVPTKQGDQQSAVTDHPAPPPENQNPADENRDTPTAVPPKLHQPYKMKSPNTSATGKSSSEEEEEEDEEDFSDEFDSDENSDSKRESPTKPAVKGNPQNQFLTNVGRDWRLGSAVSIDTVPKAGPGFTPTKQNLQRPPFQRPFMSQPTDNFGENVSTPPDKSVYNLGSAISLETVNSRSNDDSNSRREFKPYRDDFVPNINPADRNFSTFDNKSVESTSSSLTTPTATNQSQSEQTNSAYQVPEVRSFPSSNVQDNLKPPQTSCDNKSSDVSHSYGGTSSNVPGSDYSIYSKPGEMNMPAPNQYTDRSQYNRDNVRLHQDNESLAQSRDGMSDPQRKVSPPTGQDVTDFKSFKLGSSVRLEPIGASSTNYDQSRPNFSETYGGGQSLQQTSPSAMGQFSLSNNSSEAKMLTDLDAAQESNAAGAMGGSFKNFLRDDNGSSEFKLGASVSLNPVKPTTGNESRSSSSNVEDLDSYKRFRLGSGVSLDIVKPKQDGGADEYHVSKQSETMMDHADDYGDDDADEETIAARIANSIAGERQRAPPATGDDDMKMKACDEDATTEEEDEPYQQFAKEPDSSANAEQPMQQELQADVEGQLGNVEGRMGGGGEDEEEEEEEEEEERGADESGVVDETDALNLLGKIKMEVDSDSEMVKIKEEQIDPEEEEEEEGATADDESEEKKSSKRKSAETDEEGDEDGKDSDSKKKMKTDGSGSDSDSDKKDRLDRKNANFRRNIREVMDESQLDQATLNAQRQEMERLKRVQEQHRIIREVQKQIQMNKQNSKTETRVISLLQGNTSLLKTSSPSPSSSGSQSQNTVVVKLSSGSGAPQIVNKKVLEMLRSQKPETSSVTTKSAASGGQASTTTSKVTSLTRTLLNKPRMMTPSVSIAPVKPKSPTAASAASAAAPDSPAAPGPASAAAAGASAAASAIAGKEPAGGDMAAIRKVTGKAKGKDVVTISSSSSSDEDDCILISEPSEGEEEEEEEDPTNSGMHTNDTYNVPDDQGRVLINVGHPDDEPDVFLAPQIARIIKPHQIGGVRFLFDNLVESLERFKTSSGFGCILAHSMGLGKTLQVVSFCDVFLRHTEARTVLCIMPINTLQNWLAEFNMWLPVDPSNSPLAAHGEVRPRNFPIFVLNDLQKTITARAKVVAEWSKQGGVLLIGYELYRQLSLKRPRKVRRGKKKFDPDDDFDNNKNKPLLEEMHTALVKPGPDLIICDEGHRIKNSHASISQALKQIRSKRRVVLTGYPLQNNLLEYWCMVDFVRPNYLGTKTEFSNMFERPIQNGQCIDSTPQDIRLMRYRAHVLHSLLEGFVQRRSHSVLTHTLPQKEEYVLLVRLTPFQRKLYDTFMNEVVRTKAVPNPLKAFAVCCKIWNHPDVLYHFLKKRANTGEAVDLDLDETTPIVPPGPVPNMPGGIILPSLPGALQVPLGGAPPLSGAMKAPTAKRGRGRSPKNPNAPKRERKKPQSAAAAAAANKTPAVAAVMPNATSSNTDTPDNKNNQGQLGISNQGNTGPMNQPPSGDASGTSSQPCQPYNQQYNNPNQFNQYQNQSQPPYSTMTDQPSNYNQGNYGSQPPPNEFQNQFQPNYPNQNNSFNNSDNFYQNYGNYYPQNPQDGNNTNFNNSGYWNNSYYNNNDNPSNFFEGGQFNESGNNGQQQWNQDNFNQQGSNSNYNQGFGNNSGNQGYGSGSGPNQNLNATATSGALNQQMQQDQQTNSYSDLQKMEQMGQQRTQSGNMQQGGLYGSVQNDGGSMLGSASGQSMSSQNLMDNSQGHGAQSSQNQGMTNSSFMSSNQSANNMMPPPPPPSMQGGSLQSMQNTGNLPGGPQHQNLQNPASGQSMMPSHSNMGMMSGGHPPPGMHGSNMLGNNQNQSMMGMTNMMGMNQQNMSGGGGDGMMGGNQPDGSSSHMLQPMGSGQNSFGCNMQNQSIGGDHNPGGMNTLHHMPGNDQGSGSMMGGGMHNQGLMPAMNQPNQGHQSGNNDLIPPPNLQQQNRQHPMMAGRPGPGLPGGGQNKIPPPQPISQSNSMMPPHQQQPPPYDNQNYMGNMHLQNQGIPGNLQDISNSTMSGTQGMMMHNLNHPGLSNQQQNPTGLEPNFHKPPDGSDGSGMYRSSYPMPSSTYHPPSQPDNRAHQMGQMSGGYRPQNTHHQQQQQQQQQQSQHDKLIDDLFNNPSNDMTGGNQDSSNNSDNRGAMMGMSPIKNTGNNMSGGMVNIQSKPVNQQQQQQPFQPFNQQYNDPPQHGYDSANVGSSNQNQSGFSQSDLMGNYQSTTSTSVGNSGQSFGNNDRSNQYHDQQQSGILNNFQNVPQQFDSGSGSNFAAQSQGSYDNSGNYQQQSSYMSNMFGASGNDQTMSTSNQQQSQQNSGSGLNEASQMSTGFSAGVKEDKTFEASSKEDQKSFEPSSLAQKNWSADNKKLEEKSEAKSEEKNVDEDDEEKEMKSCGNQTDEKADVKAETMVKDTTYTFGEMKEVGGAIKDAATADDDEDEVKAEGATATTTALVKSGKEDPGIPYDWAERLLKGYIPGDIEASAKMAILFCILEESINLGDRILVFSQSLFTLNLIEDFLQKTNLPNRAERWARNWNYYRLDGSTSALEREKLINEFNSNPNIHLFLVSTRAGSLGINLVGANRVIVFDASWNPCHDTQAVCRVYRYGQKKPCFVYRLVMDHCLEKKIYDRQINKQGMSDRVVDECNPDAHLSIKEVTNLCWDSEETDSKPMPDVATLKDKYIDVVMQKVLDRHGQTLSKEPFQHESLLVDRKDKKLSQAEKRLAKRSYELEKQASINSRPVYGYSGGGNQQGLQIRPTFRAIRGEGGGVVNKPMASVRPMQSELSSQLVRGADGSGRPRSWIPAEVWQKQGMSAQEMTLPLDVVIPTNSPDRSSIVLKAGQKVMVLKSPKGIYMQLENGKIIAIRTAIKVGNKGEKKTDKREFTFEGKKEVAVQPNRARVQNLPIMRNNISIIPRGGGATGITSRAGQLAGNRPLARMLGQNSNRPWGTPKQPIATTKPYFGETPPVTVTVTKKKVDSSASSTVRAQAKVERNPSTEESKDKMSDDNTGETSTDDKDKQPQRSASASSGASEASRQDSSSAEMSGSGSTAAAAAAAVAHKRKGSSEQDRLRSTEEELLHDADDDDYDDEDDDDDDDDDDDELENHHMHHQHHATSHRMRMSPSVSSHSRQTQQQRLGLGAAHQQSPNKRSSFLSSGSTSGQSMRSASPSVASSNSSAGSHSHQSSSAGTKMMSSNSGGGQQSSSSSLGSHATTASSSSSIASHSTTSSTSTHVTTSTTSSIGSHSTPTSSTPSAAVGAAPIEKESRNTQMMSHHHHHQHHHQMSQHHTSQQPGISNPATAQRSEEREYNVHSRYTSSTSGMSKSGGSESSHIPTSSHPPLPKHLSSSVTVSPVAASSASSISVPMNSPSMTSSSMSNTPRPSSAAVSINPVNTPSVAFNPAPPPHPSVSMTPVSANPPPPPTYHHTPGQTATAGSSSSSTGRRYTSTEYTADALSKSSEPTSYHPALSHLKTISDHSISIFPVDSSKSTPVPSSTITSAQYGASDYNYRQDFHSSRQPSTVASSRDYYQGFGQPPLASYPSSSSSSASGGYYPSSTVTSSGAQRKDGKDSVTPYSSSASYDSSSYLPPNPFTAAAVGSGYSSRSAYPQTTPPPSQPSTTSSYTSSSPASAAAASSTSTSDFSRMYSAFHRPEPSSFQPPTRPGAAAAPPPHQFPPASPYNPYNPYLMQPHPSYPPHSPYPPPGSQPPPQ